MKKVIECIFGVSVMVAATYFFAVYFGMDRMGAYLFTLAVSFAIFAVTIGGASFALMKRASDDVVGVFAAIAASAFASAFVFTVLAAVNSRVFVGAIVAGAAVALGATAAAIAVFGIAMFFPALAVSAAWLAANEFHLKHKWVVLAFCLEMTLISSAVTGWVMISAAMIGALFLLSKVNARTEEAVG